MSHRLKLIFYIHFIFTYSFCFGQVIPKTLGKLPERIKESSGIVIGENNTFWTHNDGSDSGYIYQLNMNLEIIKKLKITNSLDIDVEDITQDDNYFYVNDMGNNANKRKNLRIYKIKKTEAYSLDSVTAELIEFSYADQDAFPPEREQMNFDCEGFFALDSSLYLLSKNRGKSTFSKVYKLPKTSGIYQAKIIDSIHTGSWVTSAAISPKLQQIAILSGNIIYLLSEFSGENFSQSKVSKFIIPYSQKEGITFKNEDVLYITDERNDLTDGCLYEVEITDSIRRNLKFTNFYIDSKNSDTVLYYLYNGLFPIDVTMTIYDMDNKEYHNSKTTTKVGRMGKIIYQIPKGKYRIRFKSEDIEEIYHFVVE